MGSTKTVESSSVESISAGASSRDASEDGPVMALNDIRMAHRNFRIVVRLIHKSGIYATKSGGEMLSLQVVDQSLPGTGDFIEIETIVSGWIRAICCQALAQILAYHCATALCPPVSPLR